MPFPSAPRKSLHCPSSGSIFMPLLRLQGFSNPGIDMGCDMDIILKNSPPGSIFEVSKPACHWVCSLVVSPSFRKIVSTSMFHRLSIHVLSFSHVLFISYSMNWSRPIPDPFSSHLFQRWPPTDLTHHREIAPSATAPPASRRRSPDMC